MSITNAVLEKFPQNRDNFFMLKDIFPNPFLCNFMQQKTSGKPSVNIDLV